MLYVSYLKQNSLFFFFKGKEQFQTKPRSYQCMKGKTKRKISKCIHDPKSSGGAPVCATNQKKPLRGKGGKANWISRETKGDIVAVPELRGPESQRTA